MKNLRSIGRAEVAGWALLAVLIGYLDFVTGPFVSMTLFYLAPVVGGAWFAGRNAGVLVALVAGVVSLLSDLLLASPSTGATLYWNTASRTIVLLIAAVVVDRVRADRSTLEAMDAQRTRSLQLLDRGLAAPAKELLELADHWDGSVEQLRAMLRPRADTIGFLARDFSEMILLQRERLAANPSKLDLLGLVESVRAEEQRQRRVTLVAPSDRVLVIADGARVRQSIRSLLELLGRADDVSLSLTRQQKVAELVISSDNTQGSAHPDAQSQDEASLSVELARLIFESQGGSLEVLRNPITRSVRATARLPLV